MATNSNGEKKSLRWIVDTAIGVILILVAAVWAITYSDVKETADTNVQNIQTIREFVARQDEINKNINEKLEQIYREVRRERIRSNSD